MDAAGGGTSPEDAAAARAAEQARIRKERREAKIRAGGSARLNKITGLGGGIQRDPIPPTPPSTTSSPAPNPVATQQASGEQQQQQPHADPDEVDISQHYYEPQTTNRTPDAMGNDQLRQMMLGFDRPASANGTPSAGVPQNPFFDPAMMGRAGAGGEDPGAEDPMMKMLQQMMGGAGGPGGMPNSFGGAGDGQNNPFAAMMGGGGGEQQQQPTQQLAATDVYAAVWRLLHFVLAVGLGLYIALLTSFSGTKIARERGAVASATRAGAADVDAADLRRYFFWTFATAETVLLTSRFFLDRSRASSSPPGILWTVMGLLPESQWKGYLAMLLRYSQIFSTVRMDMLVCIFVLGVCAWSRS